MVRTKWRLYIIITGLLLLLIYILITSSLRDYQLIHSYEREEDETPLLAFVLDHLMGIDGGIYTNLKDDLPHVQDIANNHQVLSESVGLLMLYAILEDDLELFTTQYNFLNEYLLSGKQRVRWFADPREPSNNPNTNASIDDLKIIKALLLASDAWDDSKYQRLALSIADHLYEVQVTDAGLLDYYDWQSDQTANTVTTSYLDLYTLRLLSMENEKWEPVYERALNILEESRLQNGLFQKTYDASTDRWEQNESFNMIDVLYVAVHLAEVDQPVKNTLQFIEDKWTKDQKLYGSYDSSGSPVHMIDSPAVYALAYQLLLLVGDQHELAEAFYNKLFSLQVSDRTSEYYGGFVELNTMEAFSFDHLHALIAESKARSRVK